jgi:hypothetical protein
VYGSESCTLGTPERAVDSRDEVDITSARAKRSHACRADDVEALDPVGNNAVQLTKEIVNGTLGQVGQHGTSVPKLRLPPTPRPRQHFIGSIAPSGQSAAARRL